MKPHDPNNSDYLNLLDGVAQADVKKLKTAQKSYGNSWKKRGGVSAFMMLSRKWDRLEIQTEQHGYDIFKAIEEDQRAEGILDDLKDLRQYLMLVEADIQCRQVVEPSGGYVKVEMTEAAIAERFEKARVKIEPKEGEPLIFEGVEYKTLEEVTAAAKEANEKIMKGNKVPASIAAKIAMDDGVAYQDKDGDGEDNIG